MTGIYVRIEREGHWQSAELDDLTAAELDVFIASQPIEAGWQWARVLVQWIQNNVQEGL